MKRTIIRIDEELCNGCGNCISSCAEGALQLVDGKAKLVKENFCDGFGDCIGECPTGALTIETREAEEFDHEATRAHVAKTRGGDGVKRFDEAQSEHDEPVASASPCGGGCPGSRMRFGGAPAEADETGAGEVRSELQQWPVQLHLVQPGAPFFAGRELVVLSTCAPIAFGNIQRDFIRGKGLVVACPKLDRTEGYVEKLAAILGDTSIPRVSVVRMEVPCCGGLSRMTAEAVQRTGRADLEFREVIIGVRGNMVSDGQH